MPSESSTLASSSGVEAPAGIGLVVAIAVSYVVNPLVFPPLVYGLALAHVGAPAADVATGAGIGALFLGVVPLLHVGWMRLRGTIGSLEIRDRRKRTEPFLGVLGATGLALGVVGLLDVQGQRLLAALLGCHFLNTMLLMGITRWWKISIHCASVAGALGTLAFVHYHVPGDVLGTAGASSSASAPCWCLCCSGRGCEAEPTRPSRPPRARLSASWHRTPSCTSRSRCWACRKTERSHRMAHDPELGQGPRTFGCSTRFHACRPLP